MPRGNSDTWDDAVVRLLRTVQDSKISQGADMDLLAEFENKLLETIKGATGGADPMAMMNPEASQSPFSASLGGLLGGGGPGGGMGGGPDLSRSPGTSADMGAATEELSRLLAGA